MGAYFSGINFEEQIVLLLDDVKRHYYHEMIRVQCKNPPPIRRPDITYFNLLGWNYYSSTYEALYVRDRYDRTCAIYSDMANQHRHEWLTKTSPEEKIHNNIVYNE